MTSAKELPLRVLKTLEQETICYCLLRDGDQFEQYANGGEVDLLVQEDQFARLRALLTQHGFVHLPRWGHSPHHFFVTYVEATQRWFKFDVVTQVAYGTPSHALHTDLAKDCLQRRRRVDQIFIPSPEDELLMLLLHCVLDKKLFTQARRQRLGELCRQTSDESYASEQLAACWSRDMTLSKLTDLIESEKWEALLAEHKAVAAHLARHDRLGTVTRRIRDRLLRKLSLGSRVLRPELLSVAVLGPDGAGKSTLIEAVQKSCFFSPQAIHMGLYQKRRARPEQCRLPGFGLLSCLLIQWGRYLRARYHQALGQLVIFDRYTYDALLPSKHGWTMRRRLRRGLLASACPAPDLVVMLDAPGELLFARTREHSSELLELHRQRYLAMQAMLPQMVVVDATADPKQVCREVTSIIWRGISNRHVQNQSK